jgi:hypothetical protein
MLETQSVTSLGVSPEVERRRRMIKYTVAMTIRVICLVLAMVIQGWLMWVFFAGAIFLPYFAVVLANAHGTGEESAPAPRAAAPSLAISSDIFMNAERKPD